MTSPRVVHVIHSGGIGGGPRVVLELATRVPGSHLIVAPEDGPLLADARSRDIETSPLPFAGKLSFVASIPALVRTFRGADIVHLHGQFAGFYGSMAARLAGVPALYTAHFPSFLTDWTWRKTLRNRVAESVTCALSAEVVACSEFTRAEYVRRGLIAGNRITTIYNGVSKTEPAGPDLVAGLREELGLEENAPVVLALGRLTDQKGFDVLIDAAAAALRSLPAIRFLVAGDGDLRPALENQAVRLGLADAVRFLGFRRDTGSLLAAASVVAVPSRFEAFPLVPLEAMMAGKPVVASNLPVLAEAVVDGETGMLVPAKPGPLAAALVDLLRDGSRAEAMGKRGEERARQRFGADRMAHEYACTYTRLLEGGR